MITSTGLQQLTRRHDTNSPQHQQLRRTCLWPTKQSALQSGQSSSPAAAAPNGGVSQSQSRSQSTFSAPDAERSLTAANLNAQPWPAYRAQSGCGWSTFANGAKFRVHSRHHSISRLNELARPQQTNGLLRSGNNCATTATTNGRLKEPLNLVAQLMPEKPQVVCEERDPIERQALHKVGSLHPGEIQQVSHSNNKSVERINLQTKLETSSHRQQQRQLIVHQSSDSKYKFKATNKGLMMSNGTMQSIQSLSMQLNQAKARSNQSDLNDDSGLEEPSSLQSIAQSGTSSAGKLSKLMGKKATRVKELVLQNLGKADRTADELFEMYEQNFHKQQAQALRLQKEFKNYVMCMKVNKKRLQLQRAQQQPPVGSSGGARSAFRSAFMLGGGPASGGGRQTNDSLQTATSQLVDEARLLKLREQYNYCKVMYETINSELHEELPMVYEKKMKHLLMSLQNYFSFEAQFHSNASKLFATAGDVIDELPMSVLQAAAHLHSRHQMIRRNSSSLSSAADGGAAIVATEVTDSKVPPSEVDGYNDNINNNNNNKQISAGSSGMGSSRGESSLDSSSSPDEGASLTADSPAQNHHHHLRHSPSDDANQDAQMDADQEEIESSLRVCHLQDEPRPIESSAGRGQHNVDGEQMVQGEACSSSSDIVIDSGATERIPSEQTVDSAIDTETQLNLFGQIKEAEQQVAAELDKQADSVANNDANDGVAKKRGHLSLQGENKLQVFGRGRRRALFRGGRNLTGCRV
ncbi:hypothetical protein SUGI_1496550 [Cryptomeria japonica]|uniref:BAR domain-containing protein n=1 Tax=Cryptomeria japonica TaxID=3369 RepID=A0AAD3NSN0_CRYJA|nr:hypothetical protein SUGI_1496550 [Cryptomeria japonica]